MLPLNFASLLGLPLLTLFGIDKLATSTSSLQQHHQQQHYTSNYDSEYKSQGKVITPEFSKYLTKVIEENNIPGLTLGIVRPDGEVEQGAWGIRSEDEEGGEMTVDVSSLFIIAYPHTIPLSKFLLVRMWFAISKSFARSNIGYPQYPQYLIQTLTN